MDANKVSAGFMIVSDGLYLLCHTTQRRNDKNIRQFDGQWTVIKGELDSDETLLEAAFRELNEESSLDLKVEFPSLAPLEGTKPRYSFKTSRGKQLFEILDTEGLIRKSGKQFKCTSLLKDMPPKFAHREGAPECDAFMWVRKDEAAKMVFTSQKHLFS